MSLSLLDVAIAMVFFFLLLSLVCSAANEILAALLQTRARFLNRGIQRLLTPEFAGKFYNHALIKVLGDEIDPWFRFWHKPLPSYIPSQTFALAMLDLIGKDTETGKAQAAAAGTTIVANTLPVTPVLASGIPTQVSDAINALKKDTDVSLAAPRQALEDWYNNAMERVSGAYKRRVQYVLFFLGIGAAVLVNADSVAVIERLSASKNLSAAIANAAAQYQKDMASPGTQTVQLKPDDAVTNAQQSLQTTLGTLDKLELPIGWSGPSDANSFAIKGGDYRTPVLHQIALHWIGWLITGLAVSFGAPFWFDVLNRFMIVRSTIKPQVDTDKITPKAAAK